MNSLEKQYAELLTLTQLFLLRDYEIKDRIYSETETYNYFKERIKEVKSRPRPPSPVQPPMQAFPKPLPLIAVEPKKQPITESIEQPKAPVQELALVTPAIPKADTFENMRSLYQQLMPNKPLMDKIPDDSEATKKSTLWKQKKTAAVAIFSFDAPPQHHAFLQNVAKAIEHLGVSVEIQQRATIERDLRLIIACESHFRASPELMKSFHTTESKHYFNHVPLLLLSDIAVYLKDAKQKPLLWKTLRDLLKQPGTLPLSS